MTFGDETGLDSDAFESEVLGGDSFMDPANSEMLGLGYVAPEVAPAGETSGRVDLEASSGHAAWRHRLSPNQRAAVQRFFTTPESSPSASPSDK
jgi:hypothetical protein